MKAKRVEINAIISYFIYSNKELSQERNGLNYHLIQDMKNRATI